MDAIGIGARMDDHDQDLIDAFEAGTIDGAQFPHERHVRVAWGLARRYGHDEGLRRLVAGIRAMAARAGRPEAYHETITRAWYELIAGVDDLASAPELLDKRLLGRFYSPGRLAAGRSRWLEPDLQPLSLSAPAQASVDLRSVMSQIPTAVAVLGTHTAGTVHATTISSLTSVSSDPALVSVCLSEGSRTLELVRAGGGFAVSVLASDQAALAGHFADRNRGGGPDQFKSVPHRLSTFGPVLDDAAAWMGCRTHAIHDCGDHHIVVAEVAEAETTGSHPLLRHQGSYL
jgi:flavin reductase (DIM6/NTAB) family NADH-FMN oxidoreductase RutF